MTQSDIDRTGVTIDVLGPLRVDGPQGPVTVRGVKERTLLAMLTANRGRTVPVPDLVDALWGQAPPPSAQKSLQTFVLRVRKALEPDRSAPALVITDGGGYRLAVPAAAVDAERFADLATSARAGSTRGAPATGESEDRHAMASTADHFRRHSRRPGRRGTRRAATGERRDRPA